jgi:hypothetical protein
LLSGFFAFSNIAGNTFSEAVERGFDGRGSQTELQLLNNFKPSVPSIMRQAMPASRML